MFKLVQTGSNLFKLVQTCSNLFEIVQTCSIVFKLVQTCLNLFKLVQTCLKLFKLIQIRKCQDISWRKKSPNKLFNHTIFSRINLIAQFMNKNWWMFSYWATVRNCTVHFYFLSNCCVLWSCREKSCPFIFLRVWLVGRRIKRRTTAQPAVEMHKPIRRGFALGESSGQWEKGAARIWNGANYLGICSARTLLVASPPCDMIVYFPA